MARELSIYCDESDISGKYFSNFYGGALVESTHLAEVVARLEGKKAELNLGAEVKWQKISEAYAGKYIAFVDEIFDLVTEGKLKMRVMFTQNYFGASRLSAAQRENGFFLLYYQFVTRRVTAESLRGDRPVMDAILETVDAAIGWHDVLVKLNLQKPSLQDKGVRHERSAH